MTDIPFQVALTMNNSAGELFGNRHLGVSVQRWTDLENFGEAVTLVDWMFEEMAVTGGHTIVVDLTALQDAAETEIYQLALILFCITGAHTKRVAVVGMSSELGDGPGFAQLVRRAQALDVTLVRGADFPSAVALLNETAHQVNGTVLPQAAPTGAVNTYGGSVSVWPAHNAVVLSLAGNDGDQDGVKHALSLALLRVVETGAKVLLVDTTASAPIIDAQRLQFILNRDLPKVLSAGLEHVFHVRPRGDKLLCVPDAPDVASLFSAAGVRYERLATMAEASLRLDKLAGLVPNSSNGSSALH